VRQFMVSERGLCDPTAMLFYLWVLLKYGVCGNNPRTEDDLK